MSDSERTSVALIGNPSRMSWGLLVCPGADPSRGCQRDQDAALGRSNVSGVAVKKQFARHRMNRTADGWFEIQTLGPGIRALTEWLGDRAGRFGPIYTHSYLIEGDESVALIDAGLGIGDLRLATEAATDLPVKVLLTHSHYDHVGSAHRFTDVAIADGDDGELASELSAEMQAFADLIPGRCTRPIPPGFSWDSYRIVPTTPTRVLRDGDVVDLGGRQLRVVHVPGHSPGSACFLDSRTKSLFTGDTVYRGGPQHPIGALGTHYVRHVDGAAGGAGARRQHSIPGPPRDPARSWHHRRDPRWHPRACSTGLWR